MVIFYTHSLSSLAFLLQSSPPYVHQLRGTTQSSFWGDMGVYPGSSLYIIIVALSNDWNMGSLYV